MLVRDRLPEGRAVKRGKALAIAAAAWDAPTMPRRAPDPPILRTSGIGTDQSASRLEDQRRANLTVLETTRAVLARAIAVVK
jgi:hypothetical protein